jgi:hypothetical protein
MELIVNYRKLQHLFYYLLFHQLVSVEFVIFVKENQMMNYQKVSIDHLKNHKILSKVYQKMCSLNNLCYRFNELKDLRCSLSCCFFLPDSFFSLFREQKKKKGTLRIAFSFFPSSFCAPFENNREISLLHSFFLQLRRYIYIYIYKSNINNKNTILTLFTI